MLGSARDVENVNYHVPKSGAFDGFESWTSGRVPRLATQSCCFDGCPTASPPQPVTVVSTASACCPRASFSIQGAMPAVALDRSSSGTRVEATSPLGILWSTAKSSDVRRRTKMSPAGDRETVHPTAARTITVVCRDGGFIQAMKGLVPAAHPCSSQSISSSQLTHATLILRRHRMAPTSTRIRLRRRHIRCPSTTHSEATLHWSTLPSCSARSVRSLGSLPQQKHPRVLRQSWRNLSPRAAVLLLWRSRPRKTSSVSGD